MVKKKTLLIIEDEQPLSSVLSEKFRKEKYQVLLARDGKKGLALALDKHPDLILLDIVMPQMDGLTMLKKLRKDSWGATVPVLILSNLSDSDKIEESMAQGVYDYLIKTDWKLEEVLEKVRQRLEA
jgi:DNA-binding response OmpR family regulator